MKGFIKLTCVDEAEVKEAQTTLLNDPDRKGRAAGVSIDAELMDVSFSDRLSLMSALGEALHFDKEDWAVLFMLKSGIGPFRESSVQVAIDKNTAEGRV
jgi:hypothetical protein